MNEQINVVQLQNYCRIEVLAHMATAPLTIEFKKLIDEVIQKNKCKKILFDLSRVEFVDSSFIGAIVYAYKNLNDIGGKIAVLIKSSMVYDRFLVSQLDKIFRIFSNSEEAETYIAE
ncbi:MAG: anti-sigma factor antagonist [Ignavibacteria bacterium]|jgi:anti-anti-sigma factor|nr:anti-sigma factor antagonist [Ignavibacteria bacterium]MDH7527718.1 anti-sigma factor antagonist [Ignavibacteria bacterium]NPV10956.1 anti-sigma factor antagonist [Ignavibacteria bacterium]